MKNLFQALLAISAFLITIKVLVVLIEPKMTFFPHKQLTRTPADFGVPYEEQFITTIDGESLFSWFLGRANPTAYVVFFHGNGGNISVGCLDYLVSLQDQGYSVFAFDYRGYGKSTGSPSEKGLYIDSRAAVQFFEKKVRQKDLPTVYLGHSLGGVAAACAAVQLEPDGIILQGTFPDKMTLLSHYPLFYFLGLFSRYRFSALDFLLTVKCPALVIHGENDQVVPLDAGRNLFERLTTKKEFYLIEGAGHADPHVVGGDTYWNRLRSFVESLEYSSSVPD